ncbi:monovalent cation/H+ antiporter complex subunit F [Agilicoccus flavus]|uniref:monovalent cation/H+ antiporter complex subunit F n=1 Tax=Agilicoccus flavus TaxID=2775968 RepID=UPI001CF6C313|nr:monovalent cation/H+ antiporter complex subunit F [Agilicoccus flavus]
MTVVFWIGVAVLAVSVAVGFARIATAEDSGSRAVVGDLIYFSTIGILVLIGMVKRSAVIADLVMIGSILGVLATIALSRILTRGRR